LKYYYRVKKWIGAVKRDYLDNAPIKCVGWRARRVGERP
jgi:hypothetical protein